MQIINLHTDSKLKQMDRSRKKVIGLFALRLFFCHMERWVFVVPLSIYVCNSTLAVLCVLKNQTEVDFTRIIYINVHIQLYMSIYMLNASWLYIQLKWFEINVWNESIKGVIVIVCGTQTHTNTRKHTICNEMGKKNPVGSLLVFC